MSLGILLGFGLLIPVFSGCVQSVTGFGSGIVIMLFFPAVFGVTASAAISGSISVYLNLILMLTYRKHIKWKLVFPPMIFYLITSALAIHLSTKMDANGMKVYFGAFLLVLGLYFTFFSQKIKLKINFLTTFLCSALSGTASGLFGIGGPPMVLYYLAATERKEEYLGTIQAFFFLTSIYNTVLRIVNGIYTIELIPMTVLGILGITIGKFLGGKIIDRLNGEKMKKVIYIFLSLSGLTTILTNLS